MSIEVNFTPKYHYISNFAIGRGLPPDGFLLFHLVMRPDTLTVIGLGAIGGSIAWQARRAGVRRVIGYADRPADGHRALKAGAISDLADTLAKAVRDSDLVVLAASPEANLALVARLARRLPAAALMSDVGSVKAPMLDAARTAGMAERFAGGHPMAGTEVPGFDGARPDRFRGAVVYVCPTGAEGDQAAREVMDFWESCLEAHPVLIDAEAHDRQLAWTSHLPQAVASALAVSLEASGSAGATFGPGARDTTRPAAGSPEFWTEVFLQNAHALDQALAGTGEQLERLRGLVARGDRTGLREFLERGAGFRRRLPE